MNKLIYKVWDKFDKGSITFAIEKGITDFLVKPEFVEKIRELAKVNIISESDKADIVLGKDMEYMSVKDKSDEEKAVQISKSRPVIVALDNWKIIPIENILAQTDNIIVEVNSFDDLKLCSDILEKGVSSFIIKTDDLNEISAISSYFLKSNISFEMTDAEVVEVEQIPITDRVCIDCCSMMQPGEGFLIGSSSRCLFLVHAETVENPYVATRPFRVNAGAVHSYIMTPNNKTRYLSEIKSGSELLTVNYKGESQVNIVGRIKLEKRPMLIIRAVVDNSEYSVVLQNAETVNVVDSEGKALSVCRLKKGDKIKVYLEQGTARHFGMSIKETITEK
jgi:3-dehydroquinate synthase II